MIKNEDYGFYIADILYEDFMIRGGYLIVKREIIDLRKTELTLEEINRLSDYVWKGILLIPAEMIEGE